MKVIKKILDFFVDIFNFLFKADNTLPKQSETDPPLPFEEWIKTSGFELLPLSEQRKLHTYYQLVHNAAATNFKGVLPNVNAAHAIIVVATIISFASRYVIINENKFSHEIMNHPLCTEAIRSAEQKGIVISIFTSKTNPFIIYNDRNMMRFERDSIHHRADVYF